MVWHSHYLPGTFIKENFVICLTFMVKICLECSGVIICICSYSFVIRLVFIFCTLKILYFKITGFCFRMDFNFYVGQLFLKISYIYVCFFLILITAVPYLNLSLKLYFFIKRILNFKLETVAKPCAFYKS